jgi:DNA-binding beta-propeller fold protein YncE
MKKYVVISVLLFVLSIYAFSWQTDPKDKFYLLTKIGKVNINIDRMRFFGEDSLLILDKKSKSIYFYHPLEKKTVISDIINPIDFDFGNNVLFLLFDKTPRLNKIYLSYDSENKKIKIDSTLNLDYTFNNPSSITIDRKNKYVLVADTGSLNSVNIDDKMYSLKFINYKPGDIQFDDNTREVYSAEYTTNSMLKILANGNIEQLISNYDADNSFTLDSKGNLILLDKKNNTIAKLEKGVGLFLIVKNIEKPNKIVINKYNDKVFYVSNKANEIYRIEELTDLKYSKKDVYSLKKNTKIILDNSYLYFIEGNKSKRYSLQKGIEDIKLTKYQIDTLMSKRKNKLSLVDSFYLTSDGNLWRKSNKNDSVLIAKSIFNYNKVLYSDDSFVYLLTNDGNLLRVDVNGEKFFVTNNLSGDIEIFQVSNKYILLRNGNRVVRLEKDDK